MTPARATTGERVAAGLAAAACLAVLIVAATLAPDPGGAGTHTQLGLAPCGWVVKYGRPCFTCGMTTAFAHAAHASPIRSFLTQPAGFLLALGAAAAFWGGAFIAVTGSRLGHMFGRLLTPRGVVAGVLIFLAAWVYKLLTFRA
jgi:hypothetical protein